MNRADKYNLVEGSIVNKLFFIASPIIMTQIFQMAYNLTDMFWLGRLSSGAVAASGTAGLFLWLSMAFFLVGRMGAEIGVSQNLGRGDRETARSYAQNALFIAVILGIIIATLYVIFHKELIGFFGIQEAHVERDAYDYLSIVSLSLPFTFIIAAVSGIFNGAGNSRVSMIINGVGFTLNMTLDPILIFTAGLGIRGAGIATIIAQSVAVCVALIILHKYKNRPFEKIKIFTRPDKEVIKQIFKWVTPISLESCLFTILTMMVTPLVALYGAGALATVRIGSQIESLTWLIAGGYAAALTSFIGQNFGAGKWNRIHKGFKISTWMMVIWGSFVTLLLFFGGGALYGIFVPNEPDVIKLGIHYLQILASIQLVACLEGVAAGIFRGQGKTLPPSIASIASNSIRVVLAYGFAYYTDWGLTGIWAAMSIGAALRGIWIFVWYLFYSCKTPKTDVAPKEVGEV